MKINLIIFFSDIQFLLYGLSYNKNSLCKLGDYSQVIILFTRLKI